MVFSLIKMNTQPKNCLLNLSLWVGLWLLFVPIISWASFSPPPKPFVVVIDAGHGGKDPGNRGNGYYEKKIALNIALELGKRLAKEKNLRIIYTRKTDVFVDLIERANIANKADADLFISIHCDAHSSQAYGAGTFVLGLHANQRNFEIAKKENSVIFFEENYEQNYDGFDPNNPESVIGLTLMQETYLDQSIAAADAIQKRFVKNLKRKNRTVKQAGFIVLKYTYMPSVLIETGFLTNTKEGAFLNSKKGQDDMAKAIADAIIDYKNNLALTVAEDLQTETDVPSVNKAEERMSSSSIDFRVQIAASQKQVGHQSYNWKGLKGVYSEKQGKVYRYFYGNTTRYSTAKGYLDTAKGKGYSSAFIVAYKNGKKISLEEAIQ